MKTLICNTYQAGLTSLCIALVTIVGCGKSQEGKTIAVAPSNSVNVDDHPSEGPHHGSLIELGNEEYHAELVHDDASGTVTIYLLDSSAKVAVTVDAKNLQINLSHEGKAEQFNLDASPETGDPAGKASRFISSDTELAEELDHEGAQAQLVVSIAGKQYRGAIEHDDDHEGHDH